MKARYTAVSLALSMTLVAGEACAQVAASGYSLPLDLAIDAARAAVRSCEASGYKVTVAVVDTAGQVKVP
jgi:hypothetical protein